MHYLLAIVVLLLPMSFAQLKVTIEHAQEIQVGPYKLTVGFSDWPIRADRSLDFIFMPEGGIADKTGKIIFTAPENEKYGFTERPLSLPRFARDPNSWGYDVTSLPKEGKWTFSFIIDGPEGQGEGSMDVVLLERPPFLPRVVNWTLGLLPLVALTVVLVLAWFRVRPGKRKDTWVWS